MWKEEEEEGRIISKAVRCLLTIWFAIVTNILRLLKGRINDNDTVMSITKMLLIASRFSSSLNAFNWKYEC
jgi:hypothetical protein